MERTWCLQSNSTRHIIVIVIICTVVTTTTVVLCNIFPLPFYDSVCVAVSHSTSPSKNWTEIDLIIIIFITDQQIGLMLNRDLQLSYRRFVQELLTSCGENPKVADIPIQVPSDMQHLKISPVTGLEWPRGFQKVKVPRFHDNGTGGW